VDQILGEDPEQRGEEFYGDRLLVAKPLSVTFRVFEADCRVEVLQVWVPGLDLSE
jgi:hypothetical protein